MKSKILIPHPEYDEGDYQINAAFSFRPFVDFLKNRVAHQQGRSPDLYRHLIQSFESCPQLLQPILDPEVLDKQYDLVQLAVSSLFAITHSVDHLYFHISVPYRFEIVYQSHSHNAFFTTDHDNHIRFHTGIDYLALKFKQEFLAYRMILKKFYHTHISGIDETLFPGGAGDGNAKLYRLFLDEHFIDVTLHGDLPTLPAGLVIDHKVTNVEQLKQAIPLSLFQFEGFLVRRVEDITVEQTITEVKNALIDMHTNEVSGYDQLSAAIGGLLAYQQAETSFIPYIKLNGKYILSDHYARRSLLFSRIKRDDEKDLLYDKLGVLFRDEQKDISFEDTSAADGHGLLAKWVHVLPHKQFLIHPLYDKSVFLGIVEINHDGHANSCDLLQRLEPLMPYLQLAMRNSIRHFHSRIENLIKEHFTPIQPSVEWKFADHAWHYMRNKEQLKDVEMGTVNFSEVYPVYGMIDIRNSSGERARCIQQDLIDQLNLIAETLNSMKRHVEPAEREHLNNILFRNDIMLSRVKDVLMAEDEMRVSDYLEHEIKSMFRHFGRERSEIDSLARQYLQSIDAERGFLYRHRRNFDDSIRLINSAVSRHLDAEEARLQRIYPHYFDKYKTDGIEYDIYIGDSIARNKQFDYMYLRNLRLWQMSSMVEIARITAALLPELMIPLQTTQLILVHSHPICITFRNDERRFDVEGGTNIRYELVKKRIDKVKVRLSGERLTQPNKIAIVYSQNKEAEEYEEYIRLMQKKNMIGDEVEKLELEEVQGLSGLKAIRVTVLPGSPHS
jgi:hypothetical protein